MNAPNRKSFLEEYSERFVQNHFQWKTDLSPMIEAWKKLDTKKHPSYTGIKKYVLSEWNKRTELHDLQPDSDIFEKHQDFISALIYFFLVLFGFL